MILAGLGAISLDFCEFIGVLNNKETKKQKV
jgi:hypothetical protein